MVANHLIAIDRSIDKLPLRITIKEYFFVKVARWPGLCVYVNLSVCGGSFAEV